MWGPAPGRVPGCDGQAAGGQAAETTSGKKDGRAGGEEGGVGGEEEGGVRVGAGKIEECRDGGCEAYQVEVMDFVSSFFLYHMIMYGGDLEYFLTILRVDKHAVATELMATM